MSRRPARFTQAEIETALRAAVAIGVRAAVEILPDGTIHIIQMPDPIPIPKPPAEISANDRPVSWTTDGRLLGDIYFIRAERSGMIKIGFSTEPAKRLKSLATAASEPLVLLGTVPGTYDDEKALHRKFSGHRASGEWFSGAPELLAYIAEATK